MLLHTLAIQRASKELTLPEQQVAGPSAEASLAAGVSGVHDSAIASAVFNCLQLLLLRKHTSMIATSDNVLPLTGTVAEPRKPLSCTYYAELRMRYGFSDAQINSQSMQAASQRIFEWMQGFANGRPACVFTPASPVHHQWLLQGIKLRSDS
jgi:hypothetical protein